MVYASRALGPPQWEFGSKRQSLHDDHISLYPKSGRKDFLMTWYFSRHYLA